MNASRIFIDTAPFIYLLENHEPFSSKTRKIINDMFVSGCQFFTSTLTFVEFCVGPYRSGNLNKISDFENFLKVSETKVIPLSEEIAKFSASLRVKYDGIKSMDAIQLATATNSNCVLFLTNDKQLRQVKEISCKLIE